MTKLLYPVIGGGLTWLLYRSSTDFKTIVQVNNKEVQTCMFGKINRHILNTDKGKFLVVNPLLESKISHENFTTGYKYYVHGYGLDIPYLHLHKKIYNQNGSPCDYGKHCEEKPSLISKLTRVKND